MATPKNVVVADSAHISDVVREIERQKRAAGERNTRGSGPDMVPVMSPRKRKPLPPHLRTPDPIVNADQAYDELPTQDEVTNPETGRPYRNIRFKSVRGNTVVKH